jgi:mannose-6-phosphate isomerase-like protein (cupin superfamily)
MKHIILIMTLLFVTATVWSQDSELKGRISAQEYIAFKQNRDPIFFHDGVRRPTDTNVDFFIRNWEESSGHIGHGGFVEQPYFTRGNPANPTVPGAILTYIKEYDHGILAPGSITLQTKHDTEQVFFFVLGGIGTVEAGSKTVMLEEGTGIFIPAGLAYQFINTGDDALEVVIIVEEITEGFQPQKEMLSGSYHNSKPSYGGHWCHVLRNILSGAKYANPLSIFVVSIESFDMAHPHAHVEKAEEIWNQFKGDSLLSVGKYLRHQSVGTAFMAPPDSISAHSSINYDGKPQFWLYTSVRYDTIK